MIGYVVSKDEGDGLALLDFDTCHKSFAQHPLAFLCPKTDMGFFTSIHVAVIDDHVELQFVACAMERRNLTVTSDLWSKESSDMRLLGVVKSGEDFND